MAHMERAIQSFLCTCFPLNWANEVSKGIRGIFSSLCYTSDSKSPTINEEEGNFLEPLILWI